MTVPVVAMNLPSLAEDKSDLRKQCYDRRIQIEHEEAKLAARAVADRVSALVNVVDDQSVASAYWPLPGELDPRPALLALGERGAILALPRTIGDGEPLAFHAWHAEDHLVEGRFKVMEPEVHAPAVTPTLVLVPLLAFDRGCRRLGHGKGYYDRTLQTLKANNPGLLAIGLAFAVQEVERVPVDDFDQTLDVIVTENEVHRPS